MHDEPVLTNEQIRAKGIELLVASLGPVGMVRFLQQTDHGWGDYTRDRKKWLSGPDVRGIADQIKAHNSQNSGSPK